MRTLIAAAAIALLAAVTLASCSGTSATDTPDEGMTAASAVAPTPTEPAPTKPPAPAESAKTAEISEYGFGQEGEYAWVTSLVHNVGNAGEFATVHFNLYDEAGTLIASTDQVEAFASEDGWTAIGTQVEIPGGQVAARAEATLAIEDHGMPVEPLPPIGPADVALDGQDARFVLKNDTPEDWQDLRVGIICRDDAGAITGGGSAFPALIPAGSESMVDTYVLASDTTASCTAYPNHDGY